MENDKLFENEYPLESPYTFEGFQFIEEVTKILDDLIKPKDFDRKGGVVGVAREGENAYGTWGYLLTWNGEWTHHGYTLEPKSNVGKGPIPNGVYQFNRWISPRLGKTLRLHNVPNFTNILVHVGNLVGETSGCVLAAKNVDRLENPTRLVDSRTITDWLYDTQPQGNIVVNNI